ncbi:Os04g0111225, partial [Oryza sativa Japonica Group]
SVEHLARAHPWPPPPTSTFPTPSLPASTPPRPRASAPPPRSPTRASSPASASPRRARARATAAAPCPSPSGAPSSTRTGARSSTSWRRRGAAALRGEAEALPRVRLAPVDVEWAHVLAEGWASPLRGFMREHEYLQSLHFNCIRLPDGAGVVNMSLPIVLAIGDREKEEIGSSPDVALHGPDGAVLAILRRVEIYPHN